MNRRDWLKGMIAAGVIGPVAGRGTMAAAASTMDDMAVLRGALALHPGLHRYSSPRQMAARIDRLAEQWAGLATLEQRYLALSRLLSTIRCGHTHCNPFNQTRVVAQQLFDRPTRLPLRFTWIDGQMVVLAAGRGAEALVQGTTVTRINGVPTRRMLRDLLPYARADGGNDGKRTSLMAVRGNERFETFDLFQGLLFPPVDGGFAIDAMLPDGRTLAITVPAITLAERRAEQRGIEDSATNDKPLWDWTVTDGIAVLTMPSWVTYRGKWDWKAWLDDRFASLGDARGIVIDLRDNEGGTDCGDHILSRLAGADLALPGYQMRLRYRTTPPALDPYLDTWDDSFRRLGVDATAMDNGYFQRTDRESVDRIPAIGPRVRCPVAALVGPACSSATYAFARRAKQSGLIRLFGQETGGNLRGINGGAYFFVRLPQSGLEFDLPINGYFPLTPQPDRGVMPDERVAPSIADIAGSRDPEMAAACTWIMGQG